MKKILLDESLNHYRANLHCHSTISDGKKTPEELKEFYKSRGYSAIAYTDHNAFIPHNDLTDDSFVALNAIEYDINEGAWTPTVKVCHICMIAKDKSNRADPFFRAWAYKSDKLKPWLDRTDNDLTQPDTKRIYNGAFISEFMRSGRAKGFYVTYNHPVWSLESYPQYSGYANMDAFEMVNYGCLVEGYDDDNGHCYDDFLNQGKRIYALATDDNHNHQPDDSPRCDSFGGSTVLLAPDLSYESLIKALETGSFYAVSGSSTHFGADIKSIVYEDGKVTIKTSPARAIYMITATRSSRAAYPDPAKDGEATFRISDDEVWFRFVVVDKEGYKSYSNAYFVDTIR